MADDPLAQARLALERGDYGQVLALLEPLAERHPPASPIGAGVRLMMATALMGQGRTDRAASCCRALLQGPDSGLRSQARDLLLVLEAPALRRPRGWSLTLPDLGAAGSLEGSGARARRPPAAEPPKPPPPPVGPTRAPLGFAALAAVLLCGLLLASLLGGCVQVRTDLDFAGPGRLRIRHHLRSPTGAPTPWQRRFASSLADLPLRQHGRAGEQLLESPVLPLRQGLEVVERSLLRAAELADLELPAPELRLRERNWLVGVRQDLRLDLDLRPLSAVPGLDLTLALRPVSAGAVRTAGPGSIEVADRRLLWHLRPGSRNLLEVTCWRWSPIGLGAVVIGLALVLVLTLATIRRQLGFGLPELPA